MDKVKTIKNLFVDLFPFKDLEFKIEFFDYLESERHSDKELDIILKLIQFFIRRKESENQKLIDEIKKQVKEHGIDLNFKIN